MLCCPGCASASVQYVCVFRPEAEAKGALWAGKGDSLLTSEVGQQRYGHDGLAQTHLICQDAV